MKKEKISNRPSARIVGSKDDWTIIRYTDANTDSKIRTDELKRDYENGIIEILNPQQLKETK